MPEGGAKRPKSAYQAWIAEEGVSVGDGNYQLDLASVPLTPWPRLEAAGAILNHDGSEASNDCWVVEIPPGGVIPRERHLYEEVTYVLSGTGATSVWDADGKEHLFEWQAGSLFAVPLNAEHQHVNGGGSAPVRLLVVTNAPVVINTFRSRAFVYGCDFTFADRFGGETGYFDGRGTLDGRVWRTNFIADVTSFKLLDYPERGGGGTNIHLSLAEGSLKSHISEFPVGRYKKAHRHGPGAHVVVLSGRGYSLMWPKDGTPQRYDWKPGSLIVPPDGWFHQHFNTGDEPARYLALRYLETNRKNEDGVPLARISTRLGGDQIEPEDEDPAIAKMFEEAISQQRLG